MQCQPMNRGATHLLEVLINTETMQLLAGKTEKNLSN